MSRNVVLALVGAVVIGSIALLGFWFLTTWQKSVFAGNKLNVQLCSCKSDSLVWEEDEIKALLEFYQKNNVSGDVDYLVPFVQTESHKEGYAIPSNGMSWIAQKWAPSTYRGEYRQEDQRKFWSNLSQTNQEFLNFRQVLQTGLPKCEDSTGFKGVSTILFGATNVELPERTFASINEWRTQFLNPTIEKSDLTSDDRVLVKINCAADVPVRGCMDEEACNYSKEANKDNGSCVPRDACGKCDGDKTGPGKIYECGCNPMPSGDCDCKGNKPDAAGECGGDCLGVDSSGICISFADSDGDGVWDKEDRCPNTKSQCDAGDGCEIEVQLNSAEVHFAMSGTIPGQKIGYKIFSRETGKLLKQGLTNSHSRFPEPKSVSDEGDRIQASLGRVGELDIEIVLYNKDGKMAGKSWRFYECSWNCARNDECGPRSMK